MSQNLWATIMPFGPVTHFKKDSSGFTRGLPIGCSSAIYFLPTNCKRMVFFYLQSMILIL